MRSRRALPVPIELDRAQGRNLRDQLVDQLERAIDTGLLPEGGQLPSTRTVAEALGVSRGVALSAYELLLARGRVSGKAGSGTYVKGRDDTQLQALVAPATSAPSWLDLRPGRRPPLCFPLASWRSAWRSASHRLPQEATSELGLPSLRHALRRHVEASRGVLLDQYEIAIGADLSRSLQVVLETFAPTGGIGVADLAPAALHQALLTVPGGRPITALPFQEASLIDALPATVSVLIVPSEARYPTSRRTSRAWQEALIEWSRRTGGHVIEVSMEGAARPATLALPSLLGRELPAKTAMIGSFAALLTSEMPLSYLIVPDRARSAVEKNMARACALPTVLQQQVLHRLLSDGTMRRHASALARLFEARISLVRQAFREVAGSLVEGPALDGAITISLPQDMSARRVADAASDSRLQLATVADVSLSRARLNGLVIDLSHMDEIQASEVAEQLVKICRTVFTGPEVPSIPDDLRLPRTQMSWTEQTPWSLSHCAVSPKR